MRTRRPPKQPLDHNPRAVFLARTNAELTQQQVADRCGVSKSLISEIENGTRNARLPMIRKLAEALRCPVESLERTGEPKTAEATDVDLQQVRGAERAEPVGLSELRR